MERISYYAVGHLSYLNPDSSCTLYWVTGIEPRVRCYIRFTSGRVKLLMDGHKVRSLKKAYIRPLAEERFRIGSNDRAIILIPSH